MKKSLTLALIVLLTTLLMPGRVALADEPAETYRIMMPIVMRQISLTIDPIGPNLARTLGVVQDPFRANTLYAFTVGSGVFKSTDYGFTWFPSSKGMTYLVLQSLEADPVNPGVLYAGTYAELNGSDFYGIYKSTDFGETWSQTGEMGNTWNGVYYNEPVVYAIEVNPKNPQQVFAGTRMKLPAAANGDAQLGGGGVFRSDNGGQTWTAMNNGLPNDKLYVYDLKINPLYPGQVYVTLHGVPPGGVYVSYDYGQSWGQIFYKALDGRSLFVDPINPNLVYYGAATYQGAWKWNIVTGDWSQMAESWIVNVAGMAADPYHQGHLFAGITYPKKALARSEDGGSTWEYVETGAVAYPVAFSPDQYTLFQATDFEGVYRSTNAGKNWAFSSDQLAGYSVTGVVIDPDNYKHMFVALYGQGSMGTDDGGVTWYNARGSMENYNVLGMALEPVKHNVMYAITDQTGVYRTDNSGGVWFEINSGYPAALPGATSALAQPGTLFENRPITLRDEDLENGASSNQIQSDIGVQMTTGRAPGNTIVISPFKSSVVLVGTVGRGVYSLSTSSGYNWVATSQSSGSAYALLFDRTVDGRVLAGVDSASGSLLVSVNNGMNWSASNTGIAGRTVYSLAQSVADPKVFVAGTDSGVYVSTDSGATWTAHGLDGLAIRGIATLQADSDLLYLAFTTDSLYTSTYQSTYWGKYNQPFHELIGVQSVLNTSPDGAIYVSSRFGGLLKITK